LIASFSGLPAHWKLVDRLRSSLGWTNALVSGDFEDLQNLLHNGWRQQRSGDPQIRTVVELSLNAPRSGRSCLHLHSTSAHRDDVGGLDQWPVSITSAVVPVHSGQLIRVHGWVRVTEPIHGSHDGFMIYDSLGGPALAERIRETDGWHEFALYRAASTSGDVIVTFALTGLGEVWLDDVSVSILR
jgi:hypothetical protein